MSQPLELTKEVVTLSTEEYNKLVLNKLQYDARPIKNMIKKASHISVITNKEEFEIVHEARMACANYRITIEKQAKSLRDIQTKLNKDISAKEKKAIDLTIEDERSLHAIEKKWIETENARKEAEKKEEETRINHRMAKLAIYGSSLSIEDLKTMPDIMFEALLDDLEREVGPVNSSKIPIIPGIQNPINSQLGVASLQTTELTVAIVNDQQELNTLIRSLEICMQWTLNSQVVKDAVEDYRLQMLQIIENMKLIKIQ